MPHHRIESEVQQIKSVVDGIMQRVQNYNSLNQLFSKKDKAVMEVAKVSNSISFDQIRISLKILKLLALKTPKMN